MPNVVQVWNLLSCVVVFQVAIAVRSADIEPGASNKELVQAECLKLRPCVTARHGEVLTMQVTDYR
jgi:hypothetical protein